MSALLICLAALATTPDDSGRQKIALVLEVEQGLGWNKAELESELAEQLHRTGALLPMTSSEVEELLSFEQTRQLLGCDAPSCYTDLGALLRTPYVILGSLTRPGDDTAPRLGLKLVELSTGEVRERLLRDLATDRMSQRQDARGAVAVIVRPLLALAEGELVLVVSETEAKVEIDEKTVGLAPIPKLTLAGGTHQIRVELDGFHPILRDVRVAPTTVQLERVDLIPSQRYIDAYRTRARHQRWLGIALAGLGGALAVSGATLYGLQQGDAARVQADIIEFNSGARTNAARRASLEDRRASIQNRGYAWTGMGLVGIGAAIVGAYLWQTSPDSDRYAAYATGESP